MRLELVLVGVVEVVGGQQRCSDAAGNLDQVWQDPLLGLDAVILKFDEVVVLAEDVLIHRGGSQSGVEIAHRALVALLPPAVRGEKLGNLPAQASGSGDDPRRVLGQQGFVHARLVVVTL